MQQNSCLNSIFKPRIGSYAFLWLLVSCLLVVYMSLILWSFSQREGSSSSKRNANEHKGEMRWHPLPNSFPYDTLWHLFKVSGWNGVNRGHPESVLDHIGPKGESEDNRKVIWLNFYFKIPKTPRHSQKQRNPSQTFHNLSIFWVLLCQKTSNGNSSASLSHPVNNNGSRHASTLNPRPTKPSPNQLNKLCESLRGRQLLLLRLKLLEEMMFSVEQEANQSQI